MQERDELIQIVRDLGIQLRVLQRFGIRSLHPARETVVSAEGTAGPTIAEGNADPADETGDVSRHQGQARLFSGPARPAVTTRDRGDWRPNSLSGDQAQAELDALRQQLGDCRRCRLAERRRHLVFGAGNPLARLVLVGEGPGQEEDRTGVPFVGPAGQLLDRILAAMGLNREDVYICNVVKCRPPSNRTPEEDEMRTCGQFLARQLAVIRPRHIICLGATAARYLLNTNQPMAKLRGRFFEWEHGARILATYHPAYLLRNASAKRMVWEDVQRVMAEMNQPADTVNGEV